MICRHCGGELRRNYTKPEACREWTCLGCGMLYQEPLPASDTATDTAPATRSPSDER